VQPLTAGQRSTLLPPCIVEETNESNQVTEESKQANAVDSEGTGRLHISNDKQIMNDLDRIISNLEAQQKNLATFGVPN
jgi:hypothetical protein